MAKLCPCRWAVQRCAQSCVHTQRILQRQAEVDVAQRLPAVTIQTHFRLTATLNHYQPFSVQFNGRFWFKSTRLFFLFAHVSISTNMLAPRARMAEQILLQCLLWLAMVPRLRPRRLAFDCVFAPWWRSGRRRTGEKSRSRRMKCHVSRVVSLIVRY